MEIKLKRPLFSELQYGESFAINNEGLHCYYIKVDPKAQVVKKCDPDDDLNYEYGLDFDIIISNNINFNYGLAFDIINNRLILIKMDQHVTKIKKAYFTVELE